MATNTLQRGAGVADERETYSLIGSDKVEGTKVYRSNGDKIGHVERVMIDKRSGKVAYAVMGFGGFLGILGQYAKPYCLPRGRQLDHGIERIHALAKQRERVAYRQNAAFRVNKGR